MFCKNCGKELKDGSAFCSGCGAAVNGSAPTQTAPPQGAQYSQQPAQPDQVPAANGENTIAIIGFVFAFLFSLVGLICSIIGYNNAKRGAPYRGLALAGIIISIVSMVISFIAVIIIIANFDFLISNLPYVY